VDTLRVASSRSLSSPRPLGPTHAQATRAHLARDGSTVAQDDDVTRPLLPAVLLSVALLGTACSGSSAPAASSAPTGAAATASAASGAASPGAAAASAAAPAVTVPQPPPLSWTSCKDGFQCSTVSVPLDYSKPADGTVSLRLIRIRASKPAKRVGSLLVNPGGPGVSAVDFLRGFAAGSVPTPIRQAFDLVAFDPRGTTGSSPVHCATTAEFDRYVHVDPDPDTPAEVQALVAANRTFDAGCEKRSSRILPHVSTVDAARDMDSVRAALREPKLTYLGYSYGTALGAAYLDQFPTHVRAMVLDGALDPRSTWDQLLEGQARGFDQALNSFLAWCDGHASLCDFRRAVSGDLGTAFDALRARVEKKDLPGDGKRTVGPGEFSYGTGQALYSTSYWEYLGTALADAVHGDGNLLLQLSDLYLDRTDKGYANTIDANNAVNCIDKAWPKGSAPYAQLAEKVKAFAPRYGPGIAWSGETCAEWPIPATGRPHAVSGKGSPPILVIGTTRDPATPYVWAVGLAHQLDKGVLLTHVGDGHTAYRASAAACIVNPVDTYLLTARAPVASRC
jgi:pimeloyl-ACP methyl ester carboxylesterase